MQGQVHACLRFLNHMARPGQIPGERGTQRPFLSTTRRLEFSCAGTTAQRFSGEDMSAESAPRNWSTRDVPATMRFDYFINVLRTALWPVSEFSGLDDDFVVELQEAPLGCVSLTEEHISAHRSRRTGADVERTQEGTFLLLASFDTCWSSEQYGRTERMRPGDVLFLGQGQHQLQVPSGFNGVLVKCPEIWLQTWLPEPELLAGQRISKDSRWGRVLSPMVSQLTPKFATAPPLPGQVVTDQLGAVLALAAGDVEAHDTPALVKRILTLIRERCSEAGLTADDTAKSLQVPARFLHHVLAARDLTFGSELVNARLRAGIQLLRSPAARQLTIAEVALRVGFLGPSYFSRLVRKRLGISPQRLRS